MRLVHIAHGDLTPPLLVTFGLSVILHNALLAGFTADSRKMDAGALETPSVTLGGILIGLMSANAVALIAGLQYLFYRTPLGRAFSASSDDAEIAELMGLDRRKV